MLGKCFFIICGISFVSALYCGNLSALSEAVLDGAERGVSLSLSMLGMMCLWCGIMELLKNAGAIGALSRLLRPVLRRIFPRAFATGEGADEITSSVAANMLGIGSAATPIALKAMEKLDRANKDPRRASDDMVTLTVLGSSCISLMPSTVIALRHAAGSADPYAVVIPVWICSAVCTAFALLLCALTSRDKLK